MPESGDYGGNIEALPGNILLVGNTMTTATSQRLQGTLRGMVAFKVRVDWLLAGHVDEIFAVLPDATSRAACPFAVAYASPQLALSLIQQHGLRPGRDRLMPQDIFLEDVSPELKEGEFFSQCLADYAQRRQLSRRCQRLIDANMYYNKLIEQERQRVNTILIKRNACASINWIALPQLFVPSLSVWRSGSQWGTEADLAQAINPNAVSVIALGEDLIMPQQPYPPFAREIDQRLRPLGLSLIGVDATYAHFLNGGLHCLASVVRTCRRKTIASSRVGDGRH